jgi:hypothetical protein
MSGGSEEFPAERSRRVLREIRGVRPETPVLETPAFAGSAPAGESERFEEPPADFSLAEGGLSAEAWVLCRSDEAVGGLWPALTAAGTRGGSGPKVLATFAPSSAGAPLADLAAFAALPGWVVGAPADAESTGAAVGAAARHVGPVYLRLPAGKGPTLSDGSFGFGHAPLLRPGGDITVVGVGPALRLARELAERLDRVGVQARLLDGASVKPADVPAYVRAARETGALLTVEEHPVLGGLGSVVASATSAAHPAFVRRVGFPDLPARPPAGGVVPVGYGPTIERLEEEAWELLRAKGKVQ